MKQTEVTPDPGVFFAVERDGEGWRGVRRCQKSLEEQPPHGQTIRLERLESSPRDAFGYRAALILCWLCIITWKRTKGGEKKGLK